jgi:hypothetical protein
MRGRLSIEAISVLTHEPTSLSSTDSLLSIGHRADTCSVTKSQQHGHGTDTKCSSRQPHKLSNSLALFNFSCLADLADLALQLLKDRLSLYTVGRLRAEGCCVTIEEIPDEDNSENKAIPRTVNLLLPHFFVHCSRGQSSWPEP